MLLLPFHFVHILNFLYFFDKKAFIVMINSLSAFVKCNNNTMQKHEFRFISLWVQSLSYILISNPLSFRIYRFISTI